MQYNDHNGDLEEISKVTSYINLIKKLERIELPYEFDESGPKVLVSYEHISEARWLESSFGVGLYSMFMYASNVQMVK